MPRFQLMLVAMIAMVAIGNADFSRAAESAARPNIILIMGDDMGYSDLGCFGGDARTPNLDALAADGVRFTQFYNTARCCPTRASLLTGLYPHQAGIGHMTSNRGYDGYRGTLNRQSVTIAETLRPAGYRTYMCGKWHVVSQIRPDGDKSNWPVQRGFDKFYGTITGAGSYYDPTTLCRQNTYITPTSDPEYTPQQFYYTDAISENAVRFLRQHQQESAEKPFFLYVAYTAAHWPMHAPEQEIARYRGKFDDGYAAHRAARLARMKELGLVPPKTTLSPGAADWDKVPHKEWEARCMEVYCAMIGIMDAGIGRIVAQLKASGDWDNTLILFLQDNGACAETIGRTSNGRGSADLQPFKPDQLQPQIWPPMQTRDGKWVRTGPDVMPGPAETYIAYGRGWANVSNTPFREYKHWVHEGGISTPLIAHWPAAIAEPRRGKLERQPGHLVDIMATCVDVAGATYPTEFAGQTIKPRQGVSLRPALNGQPLNRPQPLFWEHEGNRAVRDGRWKLVAKEHQPWELYDIDVDRMESNNLAATFPKRVNELAAEWEAYAARADVLPLGAWRPKPEASDLLPARRQFVLKKADRLKRRQAPAISGRGLTVSATVTLDGPDHSGVIVAQGGTADGFALSLRQGKPVFRIRSAGESFDIVAEMPLTATHALTARLDGKGNLSLQVDGKEAAKPVSARLISRKPKDGLQVGRDDGGAVGPYKSPAAFSGKIESVVIELDQR